MSLKIQRIQDDGKKFIIQGNGDTHSQLKEIFDQMALGVTVTDGEKGGTNLLYTENNRDIVLRVLYDHTDKPAPDKIESKSK